MTSFLVVLDVDSTLIEEEVIELLAAEAGREDEVAAVTERAMRGEIDFADSLRHRVAALEGLDLGAFERAAARITPTSGVDALVTAVHAAGGAVCAVSGGFHEILDDLAPRLGLDRWRANRLGVRDGRLDGNVVGAIIDAEAKAEALREWAGELSLPLASTVAVGDGANDLRMLALAGLGIAFDAKPRVRAEADVVIDRRDLAQVLPLLGLRG